MLTPEARLSAMRMRLIDKLEAIIRESVKPMERIEGIKILHVDGLGGGGGGGRRRLRRRRRRPRRQRREFRAAVPRAGAVGRSAAARDRRARAATSARWRAACSSSRAAAPALGRGKPGAGASNEGRSDDQGLHVERHRRAGRCGVGADPRLQRPAEVDAVRRRVADRGRAAGRQDRLRAQLPPEGRRRDSRAAAHALGLRLPVHATRSSRARWASTNYVATLKLTPVTDGNRTFAEWWAEFDCAPARANGELARDIGQGVFQAAFDSLKSSVATLGARIDGFLACEAPQALIRVTRSAVIDAPIERVWEVLRDFNSHTAWHPAVGESSIENGEPSDQVGCVRNFTLQGWQPHPRAAARAFRSATTSRPTASSTPRCRCSTTSPPCN